MKNYYFSEFMIDGIYYAMRDLGLLTSFDPLKKEFNINFENYENWKKYRCSRFWKKYYESDKIKSKYAKMGINYDELENDYNNWIGD